MTVTMTPAVSIRRERTASPWTFLLLAGGAAIFSAAFSFDLLVTVVSTGLQVLFFVYFLRHLAFAVSALEHAPSDLDAPLVESGYLPSVTVLVACHNEEAVVDGLVERLLRLDYPAGLLELVVIDDASSDRTGALLDGWAIRQPQLRVVHRPPGSPGAKSGALNAGLEQATGEIAIVFDADHQPHSDVVRRLARHFQDPTVSAVQGRCVIRNPQDSPLTHLVAIDYLAGYLVNEYGRQSLFQLPAYGGANCAVRVSSLIEVGGWNPASVTEDTDLTIRLKLAGGDVRYDVTAIDEEEGVVTLKRYWTQRYRWARGHQQVWRDYRSAVWRSSRLSRWEKVETTMFLAGYHVPALCALGIGVLALWGLRLAHPVDPISTSVLWTLLFLGPLLELAGGLLVGRADRRNSLTLALFLPMFFVSVALSTKAWIDGVAGRGYSWVKTRRSADLADR